MKKIEINDREVFERYHVNSIINSEYQFSTLFIWQHAYNFEYEVWNDCLIVYGTQRNGDTQVYFPIGKVDDLDSYVGHIKHIFGDLNQNVNIRPLSESMKERLLHFIDFDIEVGSKESYSDYIYDYIPLKNYSGSVYKKKRHELHRFCSRYDYKYESIDSENAKEVLEAAGWKDTDGDGNKCFEGIYPAMLHFVLNSEFDNTEYKIVNTQDDMGNENIRRTKLSYNPVCVYRKYFVKEVDNGKILC